MRSTSMRAARRPSKLFLLFDSRTIASSGVDQTEEILQRLHNLKRHAVFVEIGHGRDPSNDYLGCSLVVRGTVAQAGVPSFPVPGTVISTISPRAVAPCSRSAAMS